MVWSDLRPFAWVREYLNTHIRTESFFQTIVLPVEALLKKVIFGCQLCGQCLLHENGLVCPMRCPKTSRNGPCGGVRANGHCEVYPERFCVWYRAYYQSHKLPLWHHDIYQLHRPVDWRLINTSSFVNLLTGRDRGISSSLLKKRTSDAASTKGIIQPSETNAKH
jgi:hypothetical protein